MYLRTIIIIFAFLFFVSTDVFAAKKRIRAPKAIGISYSAAKLSRGTNSIVITFKNLTKVKKVEYTLSYTANGIPQGVIGSFAPGSTNVRDVYFGTCSKGVCTPHYGITNVQLVVTTTLTSGVTNTKKYTAKRF